MINFSAEITEVKVKKLVSSDREYRIVLVTSEPQAMQLDEFVGTDKLVEISVENQE